MFMSGTAKNEPRRGWGAPAAAGRALNHVKGAAMPAGRGVEGSTGSAVFALAEMVLLEGKKKKKTNREKTAKLPTKAQQGNFWLPLLASSIRSIEKPPQGPSPGPWLWCQRGVHCDGGALSSVPWHESCQSCHVRQCHGITLLAIAAEPMGSACWLWLRSVGSTGMVGNAGTRMSGIKEGCWGGMDVVRSPLTVRSRALRGCARCLRAMVGRSPEPGRSRGSALRKGCTRDVRGRTPLGSNTSYHRPRPPRRPPASFPKPLWPPPARQ